MRIMIMTFTVYSVHKYIYSYTYFVYMNRSNYIIDFYLLKYTNKKTEKKRNKKKEVQK